MKNDKHGNISIQCEISVNRLKNKLKTAAAWISNEKLNKKHKLRYMTKN